MTAAAELRKILHGPPHLCSSSLTGGGETHAAKAPSLGVRFCFGCFTGGWGLSRSLMAGVMSVYSRQQLHLRRLGRRVRHWLDLLRLYWACRPQQGWLGRCPQDSQAGC